MKKKILIILLIVLVCLLLFIGSATIVIHSANKEVAKVQDEELFENEHIENINVENEANNNTVPEAENIVTKEIKNNEQTNTNVENKASTNNTKPVTTTTQTKTNTQVESKSKSTQNNKNTETTNSPESTAKTEEKQNTKVETKTEQPTSNETNKTSDKLKCVGDKHFMETGNSNKWFNTEAEAVAYYKSIIKTWGDKWENFEIDNETYNKNCPYRLRRLELYLWKVDYKFLLQIKVKN